MTTLVSRYSSTIRTKPTLTNNPWHYQIKVDRVVLKICALALTLLQVPSCDNIPRLPLRMLCWSFHRSHVRGSAIPSLVLALGPRTFVAEQRGLPSDIVT